MARPQVPPETREVRTLSRHLAELPVPAVLPADWARAADPIAEDQPDPPTEMPSEARRANAQTFAVEDRAYGRRPELQLCATTRSRRRRRLPASPTAPRMPIRGWQPAAGRCGTACTAGGWRPGMASWGGLMSQTPAGEWPSQFGRILAEVLAGARPARQPATWTSEHARQRIRHLDPREVQAAPGDSERRGPDREAERWRPHHVCGH